MQGVEFIFPKVCPTVHSLVLKYGSSWDKKKSGSTGGISITYSVKEVLLKIKDDKVTEFHYFIYVIGNVTTDFSEQVTSLLMGAQIPSVLPCK